MGRTRLILVGTGIVLVAGLVIYDLARPRFDSWHITLHRHPFSGPVRLVVDGKEVGTHDRPTISVSVETPSGKSPQVEASGLFPCGWRKLPLRTSDVQQSLTAEVDLRPLPGLRILVDNRGRPAGELRVGRRVTQLAANAPGSFGTEAPDCAEVDAFVFDGKSWQLQSRSGTILIDPAGTRCYKFGTTIYGRDASTLVQPYIPPGTRVSKTFSPAPMHVLPGGVDYFLEEVPSEIRSLPRQYEVRHWVVEQPCERPAR